ncbi:hypothetical protein QCD71_10280 [Sphingomonas sp. PsM26]|nr:hypothetical protein [Sphingomonas sp. PsM26]RZM07061.1 MAG: hypothetical protein EOP67_73890 [Sphingomonas sp.]
MKTLALFLLLSAANAVPAIAQQAATTPAGGAVKPTDKKVCRSEESTGSVFVKRICHTSTEWSTIDARNSGESARFRDQQRNGSATLIK